MKNKVLESYSQDTLRIEISSQVLSRLIGKEAFCCSDFRCLDAASKQQLWHLLLRQAVS